MIEHLAGTINRWFWRRYRMTFAEKWARIATGGSVHLK